MSSSSDCTCAIHAGRPPSPVVIGEAKEEEEPATAAPDASDAVYSDDDVDVVIDAQVESGPDPADPLNAFSDVQHPIEERESTILPSSPQTYDYTEDQVCACLDVRLFRSLT